MILNYITKATNNINNFNFATKKVGSDWISLKEIQKYFRFVIWLMSATRYSQDLSKLEKHIVDLVKSNGFNFTFLYLKECLRITMQFLAGTPEIGVPPKGSEFGLTAMGYLLLYLQAYGSFWGPLVSRL
jgi:hypothetical protein